MSHSCHLGIAGRPSPGYTEEAQPVQWTADAAIVTTRRMPDHPRPASGSFVQLAGILSDWWADWLVGFVSGVRLTDSSQFQLTEAGREVYGVVTGWLPCGYRVVCLAVYPTCRSRHVLCRAARLGAAQLGACGACQPYQRCSRYPSLTERPAAQEPARKTHERRRRRGAAAAHVRQGARKAAAGGRARCGVGTA